MSSRLIIPASLVFLLSIVVSPVYARQTLEVPQPDSYQSGIGIISGWACNAQTVEISFNGGPPQKAAYGTSRADTQGVCGDTDNGFGLLYNWNLLGDGVHTVTAYVDGVEFASVTVIVTTLGEEFLRGAGGEFPVADFPTPDNTLTLRWQEAQQNFVITDGSPVSGAGGTSGGGSQILEIPQPGSAQSGIGVISGWACDTNQIEIEFDNDSANRWRAGTGTLRTDTQGVCGDSDNGFGLLFNWNLLGDGTHTVRAFADGVEFANVTVTVTTLGEAFVRGVTHEVTLPDFPEVGTEVVVTWQEAQQNFVIASSGTTSVFSGFREVFTPTLVGEWVAACEYCQNHGAEWRFSMSEGELLFSACNHSVLQEDETWVWQQTTYLGWSDPANNFFEHNVPELTYRRSCYEALRRALWYGRILRGGWTAPPHAPHLHPRAYLRHGQHKTGQQLIGYVTTPSIQMCDSRYSGRIWDPRSHGPTAPLHDPCESCITPLAPAECRDEPAPPIEIYLCNDIPHGFTEVYCWE